MKSLLLVNPVLRAISEIDHCSLRFPLVMGLWWKEYRQTSLLRGNRRGADRSGWEELIEAEWSGNTAKRLRSLWVSPDKYINASINGRVRNSRKNLDGWVVSVSVQWASPKGGLNPFEWRLVLLILLSTCCPQSSKFTKRIRDEVFLQTFDFHQTFKTIDLLFCFVFYSLLMRKGGSQTCAGSPLWFSYFFSLNFGRMEDEPSTDTQVE